MAFVSSVVLPITVAIRQFDVCIEQVAYSLGASWFRMFRSILLPNLWPSVVAAWIFALIISFDEVIVTIFLAGAYDTIHHHRPVSPRRFGHPGGVVLFRFDNGGFGFSHGAIRYVKPHHFRPPHYRGPVLTFGHPRPVRQWNGGHPRQRGWRGRPNPHW